MTKLPLEPKHAELVSELIALRHALEPLAVVLFVEPELGDEEIERTLEGFGRALLDLRRLVPDALCSMAGRPITTDKRLAPLDELDRADVIALDDHRQQGAPE